MVTTLPGGSVFVMRHRGQHELWAVSEDGEGYAGVDRALAPGETVHLCVWKGDELVPRKAYTLRPGDVEWLEHKVEAAPVDTEMFAALAGLVGQQVADEMKGIAEKVADVPSSLLPSSYHYNQPRNGPKWFLEAR